MEILLYIMYRRLRQPYVFAAVARSYYSPRGMGLQGKKRDFPQTAGRLKDFLPKSSGYAQIHFWYVHFRFWGENDEGYGGENCKMQERRRTVAIATETAGKREGLSAGKHEGAVRLSVVHGRRTFTEKGRNGRFSLMKSVKKYQIVLYCMMIK